jgi:GntR family transcriptional repressor for pyruvate dehydrogenase complex
LDANNNAHNPIKKVNVGEETFKFIFSYIMDSQKKHGDKIPSENEFKAILGVSRHTIRNALNSLSMLGILETKQGDGNYIASKGVGLYMNLLIPHITFTNDDLRSIMEFRFGIESSNAYYAAKYATDEDIEYLENKLLLCEACNPNDIERFLELDYDFHFAVSEVTKNEMLIQSMNIITKYCYTALVKCLTQATAQSRFQYHHKVLEAIRNHDTDKASQYMSQHIHSIEADLLSTL